MKQFVKNFNKLFKSTIFKVQNKTNDMFQISAFNKLFKGRIFKVKNKTNNKFQISAFNKHLIAFISLLFFYLFYLSIPVLYDKTWVQSNIESQLLKEFKINFSISSDISYRILPSPHFLIKDSKIFKEIKDKKLSLADVKNLKVFISQKNFFDKDKSTLKYVKIDNANFTLLKGDIKLLQDNSTGRLSNKQIEIDKSNIFFKDNLDKTIAIVKVSKSFLFSDDGNLINLNGEVFNIPFSFNYSKEKNFTIVAKSLRLDIFDAHYKKENNFNYRKNIISFLNAKIKTDYKTDDGIVFFNSSTSRIRNSKLNYKGELLINPFDLNLNIDMNNYELFKVLNNNSILTELIKTELLFNNNISVRASIIATSLARSEIFQKIKFNFNIVNGKINFDKTRLINKKIGLIELKNSNLFLKNNRLVLNTNIIVQIKDNDELFSLLQTNKKFRKPIKEILINLNYDFLSDQFEFNNFKIDNKEASDELLRIIEGFEDNVLNNFNKSRRLLNALLASYEG